MSEPVTDDAMAKNFVSMAIRSVGVALVIQVLIDLMPEDDEGQTKFADLKKDIIEAFKKFQKDA